MVDRRPNLIRVAGVDTPSIQAGINVGQGAVGQDRPVIPDTAAQRLSEADSVLEQGFQAGHEVLNARAQEAQANAAARGVGQFGQELRAVATTLADGYQVWQANEANRQQKIQQLEQAREKAEQEQLKQLLEQREQELKADRELASFEIETVLQDAFLSMDRLIEQNGHQAGLEATRATVDQTVREYMRTGRISPETAQELTRYAYGKLRDVSQAQSSRLLQQGEEVRQSVVDNATAQLKLNTQSDLVGLSLAQTAEDFESGMVRVNQKIEQFFENNPGLSDLDRLQIKTEMMETVLPRIQEGTAAYNEAQISLNNMRRYTTGQSVLRAQLTQGSISYDQYMEATSLLAEQFDIEGSVVSRLSDPFGGLEQAARRLSLLNKVREEGMSMGQHQIEQEARTIEPQIYGVLAHRFRTRPETRDRNNPIHDRAWETSQRYSTDIDRIRAIKREIAGKNTQLQRALDQLNPNGRLGYREVFDSIMGVFREQERFPSLSAESVNALRQEINPLVEEMQTIYQNWLPYGLNVFNPNDTSRLADPTDIEERIDSLVQSTGASSQVGGGQYQINFNQAVGTGAPAATPRNNFGMLQVPKGSQFGSYAGQTLRMPVIQGQAGTARITSHFGQRGGRLHGGIDIGTFEKHETITMQGGTVISQARHHNGSFNPGGYGLTVLVRTPDGRVEQFSHLDSVSVQPGQQIPPGTPVGRIGRSGSHQYGGYHLHFQIWKDADWLERSGLGLATNSSQLQNPLDYLAGIRHGASQPAGLGAPPRQADRAAQQGMPVGMPPMVLRELENIIGADNVADFFTADPYTGIVTGSSRTQGGSLARPSGNPRQASIHHKDYVNDPTANYGYRALAEDPEAARALAEVSDRLGISAQGLADIMQEESAGTWRTNIDNGLGYLGLIQVGAAAREDLKLSYNQIARMSRAQYIRQVVEPYLKMQLRYAKTINPNAAYRTVEDVLSAIFQGAGGLAKTPQQRARIADINTDLRGYIACLGRAVGRRYNHSYGNARCGL